MADEKLQAHNPPLEIKVDNIIEAVHEAPVILVDGAQYFIANNQTVRFNLFQDRLVAKAASDGGIGVERVICARLVMSPEVFKAISDWIGKNAAVMFPKDGA